ncbi:MAG TPA: hypothetical protein PKA63_13050 [Oligoflexia bacterium]|nr:hypothetical protein [Oligoflexia bacterium]HMP49587.1 hypothetical protein [Oligoflexia bacterium]
MGQLLSDIKLIVSTDKRIWACGVFIGLVLVTWVLTDSWRPPPEIVEQKYVRLVSEERSDKLAPLLQGLSEGLGEVGKTNNNLKADLGRVSQNIESRQEEINWKMDTLVGRLSTMTETIDSITKKVGEKQVEDSIREKRMENRSRGAKRR